MEPSASPRPKVVQMAKASHRVRETIKWNRVLALSQNNKTEPSACPRPKGTKLHKKLPHINSIEHFQFLTFRTNDSIDSFIQKLIEDTSLKQNIKQFKIDNILDKSSNGAYLNNDILNYLYSFFIDLDKELYSLVSFVIMPNHIHILFKQIKPIDITLRIIKSKSAIGINKLLGKSGKFWASDYYDKVIRDEEHFKKVYNYIENNALKAGLDLTSRYYSVYEK